MKLLKKLTNYLINKYEKDRKKEIDNLMNLELESLKYLLKQKDGLKELLWELVFEYDIKQPIDQRKRYVIYSRLKKDKEVETLLSSLYAKNYIAYFNAKDDEQRNILKGRMLQIQDIINCIVISEDRLENWDKYEKIQDKKIILKKELQEKILINK